MDGTPLFSQGHKAKMIFALIVVYKNLECNENKIKDEG